MADVQHEKRAAVTSGSGVQVFGARCAPPCLFQNTTLLYVLLFPLIVHLSSPFLSPSLPPCFFPVASPHLPLLPLPCLCATAADVAAPRAASSQEMGRDCLHRFSSRALRKGVQFTQARIPDPWPWHGLHSLVLSRGYIFLGPIEIIQAIASLYEGPESAS